MKYPVTILSGFLGSGKTTLLNHIIRSADGLRIALMINDFGDINIDKDLIVDVDGDVMELSGGCMCCTVREDLLTSAQDLLKSGRTFDNLVVETSGVADPGAVAQTFLVPGLEEHFRLDAIVTLVDSANFDRYLVESETANEQIRCADLLILNKIDLISSDELEPIGQRLQAMNADAKVIPAKMGEVPVTLLIDINAHDISRKKMSDHDHHNEQGQEDDGHGHASAHDALFSASFSSEVELDYDKFDSFLQCLPEGIYRAKGVVAIRGIDRRVLFHRVGYRTVLDQGVAWNSETRSSRAVFIGKDFDRDSLIEEFRMCATSPAS